MNLLPLYLLAGSGERLRPLTDDRPKALIEINARPILSRSVESLIRCGLRRFVVVTGYRSEMVRTFFHEFYTDIDVQFVQNDRYAETNNAYSLWLARSAFDDAELLLLDGDILFEHPIAEMMTKEPAEGNRLAVRGSDDLGWEEIKVLLDDRGLITRIGKDVEPARGFGESIGIARFDVAGTAALFATLSSRIERPGGENEFYEASFQQMIDQGVPIGIVNTLDYRCIEIDTADDLAVAERDVACYVDRFL